MSDKRIDSPKPSTGNSNAGWQLPDVGRFTGKMGKIAAGCLGFVLLCMFGFIITGWLGWQQVKPLATTHKPVMKSNNYDPLNCAAKGQWVVSWNSPEGKKYGCTAKWK